MCKQIIAIDPGTDKHGIAVIDRSGLCLFRQVQPNDTVMKCLAELVIKYPQSLFVLGNGTGYKRMAEMLEISGLVSEREINIIDEYRTTDLARKQYLKEHRTGWRKLIPLGLQTPPEPIDHYVAEILGRKFLNVIREDK
jgi:RNase H-fold protein (predicted Holliday junction resolvase)